MPADGGRADQRFCIYHPPHGPACRGALVYVHPLAEELNKTRRMAALQARALAAAGWAVLQIDLMGCGDSSGDFGDATWQAWVTDITRACEWLGHKHPPHPVEGGAQGGLWLWGLRAGCLLAADAGARLAQACNFLFWQPPVNGRSQLQQLLRLKLASGMLGQQDKSTQASLRQQLHAGQALEVGGYRLSAELASGLERAVLAPPARPVEGRRLVWLEVSADVDSGFTAPQEQALEAWRQAGFAVQARKVGGAAFWQTSEIEVNPFLTASTMESLSA